MSLLPTAKIKCIDWDKTLGPEMYIAECCWVERVSGKRGPPSAPCRRLPPYSWL